MSALALFVLAVAAPVPADVANTVELRTTDGKAFVAADEIVSYDWNTHTLTLKTGTVKALAERFKELAPKQSLNGGIPFELTVGGKKAYAGLWKTCCSSIGVAGVAIVWDGRALFKELGEDQLRIDASYPAAPPKGADPRADATVKKALEATKKLK